MRVAARWFCVALLGSAAPSVASPPPMVFDHLTLQQGLSQGTVMDVLQDSQGFIWIATENGLNRYDGHTIRRYSRNRLDSRGLPSDFIWQMVEDAHGDLWLGTKGGGLVQWSRRKDSFRAYQHRPGDPASLSSNTVRSLAIDDTGRIWVGTRGGGLNLFDPATRQVVHFRHDPNDATSLSSDSVLAIEPDRRGWIWVGTTAGLNRFDPATGESERYAHDPANPTSLSDDSVLSLHLDDSNVLWVGTRKGGLNRLHPSLDGFDRFRHDSAVEGTLSHDTVSAIFEDADQRLWIGTVAGLDLYESGSDRFTHYRKDPADPRSLVGSGVLSITQDAGGILWIGTTVGGVSRWNPRSWSFGHYKSDWLGDSPVTAIADDGRGNVWIGTLGAGLYQLNVATDAVVHYSNSSAEGHTLPDSRVMSLLYDRGGILWIGTMTAGLLRFDTLTGSMHAFEAAPEEPDGLSANGIMSLFEDADGNIWVGTFGGGACRLDRRAQQFRCFRHDPNDAESLSGARATTIAQDRKGNIWIGTDSGGLNRVDVETGKIQRFRHDPSDPDSLSSDSIYDLHVDSTGTLWVGTAGGGLDRLIGPTRQTDATRFENFSQNRGLTSDVIYAVYSDSHGHLWLSSNNGLMRLNPRSGAIKSFHRNHGLQGDEFNFGAHEMALDGRLYFGGPNGFNVFQPARIQESGHKPPVVLTGFEKQGEPAKTGKPYSLLDSIVLRHDDEVVTFEFAALDYTDPAKNQYAFMLEGFDRHWVDLGNRRRVTYTNLDARDYVFRVKAANSDGIWNEDGLAIPVKVIAPPWATRWAYGAYSAVVLLLLALVLRWYQARLTREAMNARRLEKMVRARTAEIEQSNRELQRMGRMKSDFLARMSHEIRTPMNGVLGMTELLKRTLLNRTQSRFARTIHNSAELLLQLINDILDFSKIEAGALKLESTPFDLRDLVEETVELLAGQAEERGLELVCSVPPDAPILVGDPLRIRQVLLNLVGNSIKFTERGKVLVRATWQIGDGAVGELKIEVEDTGVGIRPQSVKRIFEPFSQADESTTRIHGGSGLGLAICRQLVELMQGEISVESVLGEGSRFWFSLPLAVAATTLADSQAVPDLSGRSVLALAGNDALHEALRRPLALSGARLLCAGSVEEIRGSGSVGAALTRFEFVIADLDGSTAQMLEDMLEYCAANGARLPRVVLLTPSRYSLDLPARLAAIVAATVSKPVRQASLFNAMVGWESVSTSVLRTIDQGSAAIEPQLLIGRVLLAEDNEVNQAVAEGMLGELGLTVDIAGNGRIAVDKLSDRDYDLVLMDCQMPVMDGFEATRLIRASEPAGKRTSIVALTANASDGARELCLDAGMDDYLTKPFTLAQLRAVLVNYVKIDADSAPNLDVPPTVDPPAIDASAIEAIRAIDGSGALLARVLSTYLDSAGDMVRQLERALNAGDTGALARIAHGLKSSSGNVGAHQVVAAAAALEQHAHAGDLGQATEAVFEIVDRFAPATTALRAMLDRDAA